MTLPTDAAKRKAVPIYSGFICYFPDAIAAVAELSRIGNDQHNPGKPLHWDRSKSGDELDAQMRHILDMASQGVDAVDVDEVFHATKNAWRSMANLQKLLEKKRVPVAAPEADADGWIPHNGGSMPCDPARLVDLKLRRGDVVSYIDQSESTWNWDHENPPHRYDIIAWRYAK